MKWEKIKSSYGSNCIACAIFYSNAILAAAKTG